MKRPRFTLRFLLVVVTIAAVGFAGSRWFYVVRPVTNWECENVEAGLLPWQVRWRLGAPHQVYDSPSWETWAFDYEANEDRPFEHFNVTFDKATGRVSHVVLDYSYIDP